MKSPLIVDLTDSKWLLLEQIIHTTTSRRAKQEMSKQGITPVTNTGTIIRILILAMFFSVEITYALKEIKIRRELQSFLHIEVIPEGDDVYRFISRIDEENFVAMINGIIRNLSKTSRKRKDKTIIIDGSAITLDINVFKKRLTKKEIEKKDYKCGFSNTAGYYPGYKLTLAVEYPSLVPLAFLIHPGSPHDSRLFTDIMDELKRRRIIRTGDLVLFDRGYYAYDNYVSGIRDYRIVPMIFPKKKFDINKVMRKMNYPINIFSSHEYRKIQAIYQNLVHKMVNMIEKWYEFPAIRSLIEDIFKLAKDAFSLRELHRYSAVAVKKFIAINVLLIGVAMVEGNNEKKLIQRMSEW